LASAKRVALKALTSPINGAQELKYDSTNPGVNAWAIKKGRQIIVHFRASRTAIDEIIEQQNRGKAQVAVNEICLLEPHALLDQ